MSKLSPEIDRMLWSVAESNDPRAIEELGDRYPAYRSELTARIKVVRSLKESRPLREAPRLTLPQQHQSRPVFGRAFGLATGAAVLATMAIATVVTMQNRPVKALPDVKPVSAGQPIIREPENVRNESRKNLPTVGANSTPFENQSEGRSNPGQPPRKLVTYRAEAANLKVVISDLAAQQGFRVDFAPGLENEEISASYSGVTLEEALADLGQNFGFTALDQGNKVLLIIPAVDDAKQPVTLPEGSHSEALDASTSETPAKDTGLIRKN